MNYQELEISLLTPEEDGGVEDDEGLDEGTMPEEKQGGDEGEDDLDTETEDE